MTMALDRGLVATDAGRVAGGEPGRPDPEVPERARRRSFTARYKLEVLAAYDAAEPGEKGAILRREGLYSSHIVESRRARDAGALAGAVTANVCPGSPEADAHVGGAGSRRSRGEPLRAQLIRCA
jgi:hypothetical protein